jgi:hypothetical protein
MSVFPAVLPRLSGIWLTLFRALFCVAFAVTLFSAAGATWLDMRPSADAAPGWRTLIEREYAYGIRIFPPGGSALASWRVVKVFSSEAAASGLQDGAELIAIGSTPVTHTTDVAVLALALPTGESAQTTLRVRGPDGALSDHTLTFRAANTQRWYSGSGLDPWRQFMLRRVAYDLMTLLLLGVSLILFLRRSHDPVAAAFAFAFCLIPVGPTIEFWTSMHALEAYRVVSALAYIPMLMVGCAFPDGRYWPSWTRFALVLAPVLLIPAMFAAIEYTQFTLIAAPLFLATIVILALRFRHVPAGVERQQFRWAAFGLIAGVLLLITRWPVSSVVQASLNPGPLAPWVDLGGSFLHALGYAVIAAGFGVSLLKYRLYDAESFIGRSAAIATLTLLLPGVWAATEKALEFILPSVLGQQQQALVSIISAGFAVVAVTSLHGRAHRWIEHRFQKGVSQLKSVLPAKLDAMALRFDVPELCEKVLSDVAHNVRATKSAIVLSADGAIAASQNCEQRDIDEWRGQASDADATPTFFEAALVDPVSDEPVGALLVGPRPDGTRCNRDERDALLAVAPAIARAIATARARAEREEQLLARLGAAARASA